MLPICEARFVKNEIKALKYIQNELMELAQRQAEYDMDGKPDDSIYKKMILPLLGGVESGSFLHFASPVIYIQGYSEEPDQIEVEPFLTKQDKSLSANLADLKRSSIGGRDRLQSVALTQMYGASINKCAKEQKQYVKFL